MEYIRYIDDYTTKRKIKRHIGGGIGGDYEQVMDSYVIARPSEATGLLKWRKRVMQAIAVLRGKAIAVKFYEY